MINSMTLRNIICQWEDMALTRNVDRDMLIFSCLIAPDSNPSMDEFFNAACDYLERFDDDVAIGGTNYAKIDEVF